MIIPDPQFLSFKMELYYYLAQADLPRNKQGKKVPSSGMYETSDEADSGLRVLPSECACLISSLYRLANTYLPFWENNN